MNDVSIIIVTWNNENDIETCIESIRENLHPANKIKGELIVIDNNSSDNTISTLAKLPQDKLSIYRNKNNTGFSRAVNQGFNQANAKYIFLLNPDTILKRGCIEILTGFLERSDEYGACTPLLRNEDGTIQHSIRNFPDFLSMFSEFSLLAYLFPNSKVFGRWKMKYFKYEEDADVCQPMAAALMIKKSVIDRIGLMDERFFMFFNDVDLCRRIIEDGGKIRFLKDAQAIHMKGTSIYKNMIKMIRAWNQDCIKYFEKYYTNVILLIWLRLSLKISEILRILYYKAFK